MSASSTTAVAPPLAARGLRMRPRLRPPLVALAVVAVLLPALPYFVTVSDYTLNIFMQAATYAIPVLGLAIVLGYTGQINLAQAAFFGLGAYTVALATVGAGLSFWLALPLGVAISAAAGVILGLTTLRIGGHYLAMMTIAFQQIFDLVANNWIAVTRGPDGIPGIPRPSLLGFVLADARAYLVMCAVALYAVVVFVWWLPGTRLGRTMRAVRENELAAEVTGVHTLRVKVIAFTVSSALAGLGGGLYAAGFAYVSPDNFSFGRSVEFLTMVLLGGVQSPFGATLGTVLLILLPEWLRFLKGIYLAVYGLAVILIMVFMPEGIWGLLRAVWQRVAGAPPAAAAPRVQPLELEIPTTSAAPMLELRDVKKHFGGLKAVDGVDLQVARGTVHALIGPNGSGKTTILNVLNGIYRPTSGGIVLDGEDVTRRKPHERAGRGLGRTFQNIRLFSALTALENVMVGAQRAGAPIPPGDAALRERALSALAFVGLADRADVVVRSLPYGHQRLVEIARALAGHPKLLLLDEPAAGLNPVEKQNLVELLKRLRSAHGLTIFLIEHDMGLIEQVADRISVLNFGRRIADGAPAEVLRHPDVIAAYLGTADHAAA